MLERRKNTDEVYNREENNKEMNVRNVEKRTNKIYGRKN